MQQRLIELATELAAKHPGEEYNLVVCDGNVPEEGAALEAALTRALPNAHRVLHGKIDATPGRTPGAEPAWRWGCSS